MRHHHYQTSHRLPVRLHGRFLVTSFLVLLLFCTATLHLLANRSAVFPVYKNEEEANLKAPKVTKIQRTKRRLPGCIIIGVRKGGTRALLEYLNIHPDIRKAIDEVHFFNNDTNYKQGLDWYVQKMPPTLPQQITVEKTPAYFTTESVPARVKSMNASVKLILIVREPVTRLISDYAQLAANKARRIKVLPSFEKNVILSDGTVNTDYKPVLSGIYSLYFKQWLEYFPKSQIHVVDGDRMVLEPLRTVQEVERFLGLPPGVGPENFVYNIRKGFYCPVKNGTSARCLNDSKGRPHPTVSDDVLRKLKEYYAPLNQEFYQLVGRRFDWPDG